MKRCMTILFLLTSCGAPAVLLPSNDAAPSAYQELEPQSQQTAPAAKVITKASTVSEKRESPASSKRPHYAYHKEPPTGPLPPTLDPAQFKDTRTTFVAYTLAAQIEEVLYQVPCYCGCDKEEGHQSLLDCFTGKHGVSCQICKKEAVFCFLQLEKGKNPAQIRKAMAKGKASQLDLAKLTDHLYSEIEGPPK